MSTVMVIVWLLPLYVTAVVLAAAATWHRLRSRGRSWWAVAGYALAGGVLILAALVVGIAVAFAPTPVFVLVMLAGLGVLGWLAWRGWQRIAAAPPMTPEEARQAMPATVIVERSAPPRRRWRGTCRLDDAAPGEIAEVARRLEQRGDHP